MRPYFPPLQSAGTAWLAMACWLLVFPGHFCYQTAVQRGLMPPLRGGYYTASIAVTLLMLTPSFVRVSLKRRAQAAARIRGFFNVGLLFWIYLTVFALATLVGALTGANPEITGPLFAYILKFAGLYVLATLTPWDDRVFLSVAKLVHVAAFVVLVTSASEGAYLANFLDPLDEEFQMDYHGLAFGFSVMSLAAAYATKPLFIRLTQWLMALAGLFLIGARSEFVGIGLAIVLIELMRRKSGWDYITFFSLPIVTLVAFVAAPTLAFGNFDSRMLGLLDMGADQSVIERRVMSSSASQTILDNPIFGSFASYAPGQYAHNIMSAWVDLGVAGFLILVVLLTGPLVSILMVKKAAHNRLHNLVLGSLGMCLLLLIFSKTYFYQLIPIAVGIYTRAAFHHRPLEKRIE